MLELVVVVVAAAAAQQLKNAAPSGEHQRSRTRRTGRPTHECGARSTTDRRAQEHSIDSYGDGEGQWDGRRPGRGSQSFVMRGRPGRAAAMQQDERIRLITARLTDRRTDGDSCTTGARQF